MSNQIGIYSLLHIHIDIGLEDLNKYNILNIEFYTIIYEKLKSILGGTPVMYKPPQCKSLHTSLLTKHIALCS